MKKYLLALLLVLLPINVKASEIQVTCNYSGDFSAIAYFYDDGSIKTIISPGSSFQSDRSKYVVNGEAISEYVLENNKCPQYFTQYRNPFVQYHQFFTNSTSLSAFTDADYGWFGINSIETATLYSSSTASSNTENNVSEDETLYTKTYSSSSSTSYGDAIFSFKYNGTDYTATSIRLTGTSSSVALLGTSISDFQSSVLDASRNGNFPQNIYCGKISASLTVSSKATAIVGDASNGNIACAFDISLFGGSTSNLTTFKNPDYSTQASSSNSNSNSNRGFSSGGNSTTSEDTTSSSSTEISVKDTTITSICASESYRKPMKFLGTIITFAKVIVPLVIIVFGVMDLYKAVVASKDDAIKKAARSILIRVIAGMFIFLLPGILQFILTMVDDWSSYEVSWSCCTECLFGSCDVSAGCS